MAKGRDPELVAKASTDRVAEAVAGSLALTGGAELSTVTVELSDDVVLNAQGGELWVDPVLEVILPVSTGRVELSADTGTIEFPDGMVELSDVTVELSEVVVLKAQAG